MAEAIINHLQIAHSPPIVTLSNAIGQPVTVEAQYSIFVDVGEVGLGNQVASNNLVVSGFGIVVDVFFGDDWCNLIPV